MQKIIFYLRDNELEQLDWAIIDSAGVVEKSGTEVSLLELSSLASDKEVILIAPSEDVLLLQTTLPKLSRHKIRQVLPFSLEDQLLADVSDLHFAFDKQNPDNTIDVAVIARHKMDSWLQKLKEADIYPAMLLPACLLPPLQENTWHAIAYDNTLMVRTNSTLGFGCDIQNSDDILPLRLSEETKKPDTIYLSNYSTHSFSSQFVETQWDKDKFIRDMARWALSPPINLLQGKYLPKNKKSSNKKIWQLAGYAFLIWIGLVFFSNMVSFFILHHQLNSTDYAINQIYKYHFPQASAVVEPKKRLTAKLNTLLHENQNNPALLWLADVGKSLSQSSGVKILQMDYRNKQLILTVSAAAFTNLDTFTQLLTHEGLSVKQQNVASNEGRIKGTVLINDRNNA